MNRMLRVPDGVLVRDVQGELVLLHSETGESFALDEVATRAWQLISEKRHLAAVHSAMQSEYAVDPASLATDLERLVDDLVAKGLLDERRG